MVPTKHEMVAEQAIRISISVSNEHPVQMDSKIIAIQNDKLTMPSISNHKAKLGLFGSWTQGSSKLIHPATNQNILGRTINNKFKNMVQQIPHAIIPLLDAILNTCIRT